MTRKLRNVIFGAVTLGVLCCVSPAAVQADHRHGWSGRAERYGHVYRPYHYGPSYGYYAPADGYYYYPGVRRYYGPYCGPYYGVPGYGYYRRAWGGGEVHAGPVHVWW